MLSEIRTSAPLCKLFKKIGTIADTGERLRYISGFAISEVTGSRSGLSVKLTDTCRVVNDLLADPPNAKEGRFVGMIKTVLVASAAIFSVPASAAEYIFSIGVSTETGYGTFVTEGDASTGFTRIKSLSGTFANSSMILLEPRTTPFAQKDPNDNLFTNKFPFLTLGGLGFSANGRIYNIYGAFDLQNACSTNRPCYQAAGFYATEAPSAVPEPSTWAMLLLGFFSIGGAMRAARSRQKVTVSYG